MLQILIVSSASTTLALAKDLPFDEERKVWSVCAGRNSSLGSNDSCRCPDSVGPGIQCGHSGDIIHIQPCYCMYYEQSQQRTLAGNCMSTCYNGYSKNITRYSVQNGSLFNRDMCSSWLSGINSNREGRFCGHCKKVYGLAVYSYHYTECIPCKDYGVMSWLRYFAISLLPLTIFYFVVVLLKINVSSSRLSGSVFIVQCWLSPMQLRLLNGWLAYNSAEGEVRLNSVALSLFHVFVSVMGMANLDFFRSLYPSFCLHPKLNILHVTSLDFIVALYPFVLILLTHLLVSIYDKNYRLVVWMWKPFKVFTDCYQRQFNEKGSLIEAFATFILLSNVKILGVCFDLLVPTRAYDENGHQFNEHFLYYDASIEYFGSEHLPFAVLALLIGFVFVIVPFILLLLYPCRCFQKLLNVVGWKCQALHIFMDAFQGDYKSNLRFFSAFYLLLRFLILLTLITESVFFFSNSAFVLILGGIVFAAFQPYKISSHNRLDMIVIFTMVMFYTGIMSYLVAHMLDQHWRVLSETLVSVSFIIIAIIFLVPAVSFFVNLIRAHPKIKQVLSSLFSKKNKQRRQNSSTPLLDTLDEIDRKSIGIIASP